MKWMKIFDTVPENGRTITMKISNKTICIVNQDNKLSAFKATCPHAGADLRGGWCEGGYWICPVHRYKYNLENGRGADGQGDYLKIYPIEIRENGVFLGFEKKWWDLFS